VERPERKARGEDAYLMPDQWEQLVACVKPGDPFHDVITVMKETGCRPQEIRRVEARHLDRKDKCWVFPIEESKGKKKNALSICRIMRLRFVSG
jgi:integrase